MTNICPSATGRCMSRWRSMLSERCNSTINPIIQAKRNTPVITVQTPSTMSGEALSAPKPKMPPSRPPTKAAPPSTNAPTMMITAKTAPKPPPRAS